MCWKLLILPQMHVLGEIYMFPHPSWLGLFATKCAFLHLENCVCRKYSFKKLTEFSQRNQVLHAAANNTAGFFFFFGDLWASFTQLNRPIWNQWSLLQLKKWFAKGLSLKTNSILTGKQVAGCSCFYYWSFSFERYMCLVNSAYDAYLQ
jgi:hypothetical protein